MRFFSSGRVPYFMRMLNSERTGIWNLKSVSSRLVCPCSKSSDIFLEGPTGGTLQFMRSFRPCGLPCKRSPRKRCTTQLIFDGSVMLDIYRQGTLVSRIGFDMIWLCLVCAFNICEH